MWDEVYHLASSEKYLTRTMFMESHAPLGKMLIAAGEYLINPNPDIDKSSFTKTDIVKHVPPNYSFAGVRFIPSLLGTLGGLLFLQILLKISRNPHISFVFSSLYIFENSLIVQSRGAFLEGPLIFFVLLSLLYTLHILSKKKQKLIHYLLLGIFVGLGTSIQWMGLLSILLATLLLARDHTNESIKTFILNGLARVFVLCLGIALPFLGFYYLHIAMGKNIAGNNYFTAGSEYRRIIDQQITYSPVYFPHALSDHLKFAQIYNSGIPRSDICKNPNETGTSPLTWPFGHKSILYRWDGDGENYRYIYFQGNPVVWLLGLFGVFMGWAMISSHLIFHTHRIDKERYLLTLLLIMHAWFLFVMYHLEKQRAFYLYHYLPALLLSLVIAFIVITEIAKIHFSTRPKIQFAIYAAIALSIIATFIFYSPLTYHLPISNSDFTQRIWFGWWSLKPAF
jgi:dolichyl-phosphate-mannose-protein mannosyltransferase